MEFDKALEELKNPDNQICFVTGGAGTGKTHLVKEFLKWNELQEDRLEIALLGSTHQACSLFNGMTYHSFFKVRSFYYSLASSIWAE